ERRGSSPGGNCIFSIPVVIGWNCATQPGTQACRSRPSRTSPRGDGPGLRGGPGRHHQTRARACSTVARRAAAGAPCWATVAARTTRRPAAVVTTPCRHAGEPYVAGVMLAPQGSDGEERRRPLARDPPAGAVTSRGTPVPRASREVWAEENGSHGPC